MDIVIGAIVSVIKSNRQDFILSKDFLPYVLERAKKDAWTYFKRKRIERERIANITPEDEDVLGAYVARASAIDRSTDDISFQCLRDRWIAHVRGHCPGLLWLLEQCLLGNDRPRDLAKLTGRAVREIDESKRKLRKCLKGEESLSGDNS